MIPLERIADIARTVWPILATRFFRRKTCAGVAIGALILGELFPEYDPLAKIIAGGCVAESAVRIKRKPLDKPGQKPPS